MNTSDAAIACLETRFRRIHTPIPVPASLPLLERMAALEPRAMGGQPPVIWERAEGFQVHDPYGNTWIDFSSGVLVANAGHGRAEIADAIRSTLDQGLHHHYCFAARPRLELLERLAPLLPPPLEKIFLLTTGSEAIECAIKLARTYGLHTQGEQKTTIVSFHRAFHGRTLGAQMVGGIPTLKEWIVHLDPCMVQVPFPDAAVDPHYPFSTFEQALADANIAPSQVAGVISETYQGGTAAFAPAAFMRELRAWCDRHDAVLILDEVQAGFGRTGTMFGFEHYGITPDLACFGKGITSGLPLSAVAGKADLMDLHPPGSMSSTHSGNPIACRAAAKNLELIVNERLVDNARAQGAHMHKRLEQLRKRHPLRIDTVRGKGLVAGLRFRFDETGVGDGEAARAVVDYCVRHGVMLFAPVGPEGATVKLNPPLMISREALDEGLDVVAEAAAAVLA